MEDTIGGIDHLVNAEIDRSNKQHGPLASAYEGYAVILKEREGVEPAMKSLDGYVYDLWDAVKNDDMRSAEHFCVLAETAVISAANRIIQMAAMVRKTRNAIISRREEPAK